MERDIDKKAGHLSDDELQQVAGGKESGDEEKAKQAFCKECNKWVSVKVFSGGRCKSSCGHDVEESTIRYVNKR